MFVLSKLFGAFKRKEHLRITEIIEVYPWLPWFTLLKMNELAMMTEHTSQHHLTFQDHFRYLEVIGREQSTQMKRKKMMLSICFCIVSAANDDVFNIFVSDIFRNSTGM